jgi:hypothetical protein
VALDESGLAGVGGAAAGQDQTAFHAKVHNTLHASGLFDTVEPADRPQRTLTIRRGRWPAPPDGVRTVQHKAMGA